jgi:hypothetical protein
VSEPYAGSADAPYDVPADVPDEERFDADSMPNTDPGAPLDSQGIPDYADDASPERGDLPEPQRFPTPTEAPAASTGFGTTAAEQRAGESLDQKLSREAPGDDAQAGAARPADEHSPYEREIPPAESDLAVHETLPGEIG